MKELAVKKEPPAPKIDATFGPAPRATNPYGSWKPVVNEYEIYLLSNKDTYV